MGLLFKLSFIASVAIAVLIGLKVKSLYDVPPLPPIEDTWWGPQDRSTVSTEIQTFKINFPEKVVTYIFLNFTREVEVWHVRL